MGPASAFSGAGSYTPVKASRACRRDGVKWESGSSPNAEHDALCLRQGSLVISSIGFLPASVAAARGCCRSPIPGTGARRREYGVHRGGAGTFHVLRCSDDPRAPFVAANGDGAVESRRHIRVEIDDQRVQGRHDLGQPPARNARCGPVARALTARRTPGTGSR